MDNSFQTGAKPTLASRANLRFLLTTYNRPETTEKCLHFLKRALRNVDVDFSIWVVDASTDKRVRKVVLGHFPQARVISASSDVFWAEGMAAAENVALSDPSDTNLDYLVWLNDDVELFDDAIARVLDYVEPSTNETALSPVLVCPVSNPSTGEITFGGRLKNSCNPLKFRLLPEQNLPAEVDTFNGNLVFVPIHVARILGGISGHFSHHWADYEYGIRNMKSGGKNLVLPGKFGWCLPTALPEGSAAQIWSYYRSPKGSGHMISRTNFLTSQGIPRSIARVISMVHDIVRFWRVFGPR